PFVKTYHEERENTLMLVVDQSGSCQFGRPYTKAGLAVEVAAVLALAAARHNDRVGALMFADKVEVVLRPAKGRPHALRVIRDLGARERRGGATPPGADPQPGPGRRGPRGTADERAVCRAVASSLRRARASAETMKPRCTTLRRYAIRRLARTVLLVCLNVVASWRLATAQGGVWEAFPANPTVGDT